ELNESEFKELYFKRWRIEVEYDVVKNKLELPCFGGFSENVIMQDFWITMYLANMVAQAMEHVAREMDAPASREVEKLMRETNLRVPLETALENMSSRVQSKDFDLVITAVLIQRQVGGNLSQILDSISNTINARLRMRREIKTLTSQGRLSGIILALLPIALAVFINTINPSYLKPLFEEEIGHIAIGIAIFLEIIGFIVIKRIVNIDT
ncbi:MAG: type II secretion system F family protein, partial [Anaerovibrio sp.]|nr:type II secretion system F family protein [Anaerovibrio sp.]